MLIAYSITILGFQEHTAFTTSKQNIDDLTHIHTFSAIRFCYRGNFAFQLHLSVCMSHLAFLAKHYKHHPDTAQLSMCIMTSRSRPYLSR